MMASINKEANIVVFVTCEWAAEFFKEFSTLHKTLSERQQIHVFVNAKDAKTSVEVGLVQAGKYPVMAKHSQSSMIDFRRKSLVLTIHNNFRILHPNGLSTTT